MSAQNVQEEPARQVGALIIKSPGFTTSGKSFDFFILPFYISAFSPPWLYSPSPPACIEFAFQIPRVSSLCQGGEEKKSRAPAPERRLGARLHETHDATRGVAAHALGACRLTRVSQCLITLLLFFILECRISAFDLQLFFSFFC